MNTIGKPGEFAAGFIRHVDENDMYRAKCTLKNASMYVTHCHHMWVFNEPVENQNPIKFANEVLKVLDYLRDDGQATKTVGLLLKEITHMLIFIAENARTWQHHMRTWAADDNTQNQCEQYIDAIREACNEMTQINID